eukprot:g35396.t1
MRLRVKMEAEQIVRAHREAERRKTDAEGVRQAHLDQIKFQVGDIVLLYQPQVPKGVSSKLFTHWKGLYQIMEQTGPLNYKIRGYPPYTRVFIPAVAFSASKGLLAGIKMTLWRRPSTQSAVSNIVFFDSYSSISKPAGAAKGLAISKAECAQRPGPKSIWLDVASDGIKVTLINDYYNITVTAQAGFQSLVMSDADLSVPLKPPYAEVSRKVLNWWLSQVSDSKSANLQIIRWESE